jgi:hypothetical protein
MLAIGIGFMIAGVIYVAIFAPLTWFSARAAGRDPLGTLLLLDIPPGLLRKPFLDLSVPSAQPFLFALATLYGVMLVVVVLRIAAGGLLTFASSAVGIYIGCLLTGFLSIYLFGGQPISFLESRALFLFTLAYLMLSYYAATAAIALSSKDELSRGKYDVLFGGAQGLFAGWILSRGYGNDAAVFAGMFYLFCTFVATATAEMVFRQVLRVLQGLDRDDAFALFWEERSVSYTMLLNAIKTAWKEERFWLMFAVVLNCGFPLLVAILRGALP